MPVDEEKVLEGLVKRYSLNKDDCSGLGGAKTTAKAAASLKALGTRTETGRALAAISKFRDLSAQLKAIDILSPRTPKFMYFSHYDRMSGALSINQLNAVKQAGKAIDNGDRVFLDFLEYAGRRSRNWRP